MISLAPIRFLDQSKQVMQIGTAGLRTYGIAVPAVLEPCEEHPDRVSHLQEEGLSSASIFSISNFSEEVHVRACSFLHQFRRVQSAGEA